MNYNKLFEEISNLPVGQSLSIIDEEAVEIYVVRPEKQFKDYDSKKNFQIFIREGDRKFRPNHLRIMIDLHLRVISRPDLRVKLLLAFDKIFDKEDSVEAIKGLEQEEFRHYLNSLKVIAVLDQLFLIEQELNYTKESKYNPVTLFYQGWVRQSINTQKEIDNLVMSICRRQPPNVKYTHQQDRNHKKFKEKPEELWYLK